MEKIVIEKPSTEDLGEIGEILGQWTESEEVYKYLERIKDEIAGKTEFNMCFFVARIDEKIFGIAGLADPLPKVLPFAKTENPGEIKILYVDKNSRRQGIGQALVKFIENEAKEKGYTELLIRSAAKYEETAYGFYKKMGYGKAGVLQREIISNKMQVFAKIFSKKHN